MRGRFQRLAGFFEELDRGMATMRGEVEPGSYRGAERPGLFGGRDDSGERLTAAGPVVRIQIREGRGR